MHPVTRLGRVIQQLRSFSDLHVSELDALAAELEAAGATEAAARIGIYRDVQRDEGQLVVDELSDIQHELASAAAPADDSAMAIPEDQWRDSPKRAQWLAQQAIRDAQARAPRTRRAFLGRG